MSSSTKDEGKNEQRIDYQYSIILQNTALIKTEGDIDYNEYLKLYETEDTDTNTEVKVENPSFHNEEIANSSEHSCEHYTQLTTEKKNRDYRGDEYCDNASSNELSEQEYEQQCLKISNPVKKKQTRKRNDECYNTVKTKEEKELYNEYKRNYYKKLSPEKKEEMKLKQREYKKKLTAEQKDKINQRNRENRKKLVTQEFKEKQRQRWRQYMENLTPAQKEKRRQRHREYYKERRTQGYIERQKNRHYNRKPLSPEAKEKKLQQNREYRKKQRMKKMMERVICYMCRVQFLNNSALLKHIIAHVTLPSVTVSRIDNVIKKEIEKTQINDLHSDVSPSVVHIKAEYDEDLEVEVNSSLVNIKTEVKIEFDDALCTDVKKEIEYT